MTIHQNGPFAVNNGLLVNIMNNKPTEHPALLIDDNDMMPIVLKMGNADFVQAYFNTLISNYADMGKNELGKDLHVVILNTPALSMDDIASVFNASMNCTGHPILHALCNMTNDITLVKEHIASLQRAGY